MKAFSNNKLFLPAVLALLVMVFLPACDDDEPEELAVIENFEWYAAGPEVAPLFRAFPLLIDSIYLRIRTNIPHSINPDSVLYRMYFEMYDENKNLKKRNTGIDQPDWGARYEKEVTDFNEIVAFSTINAEDDQGQITLDGIYKRTAKNNKPILKMEFVYNKPGWPAKPNATDGFGSTENGAYGDNNIHTFTKLIQDNNAD